ncbi:hypothetical protein Krac_0742 [Ktedonobacter racemifer DSM 44963]|uniref:Uncharacterized protein n=1 Tax=Ktedonobacter racemifer DSM 44963 TaxID=485913 RepID=D6U8G4_KTERA|nr:hypothetical protein Krac_0742 [Ktedonobacter racemifer DSM 44963]
MLLPRSARQGSPHGAILMMESPQKIEPERRERNRDFPRIHQSRDEPFHRPSEKH